MYNGGFQKTVSRPVDLSLVCIPGRKCLPEWPDTLVTVPRRKQSPRHSYLGAEIAIHVEKRVVFVEHHVHSVGWFGACQKILTCVRFRLARVSTEADFAFALKTLAKVRAKADTLAPVEARVMGTAAKPFR